MRRPQRVAGDPDAYRPRAARQRGGRALRKEIDRHAEPRSRTTGDEAGKTGDPGGGSGGGGNFGWPFITALPEEGLDGGGGVIDAGDPDTGLRYAIWDHFCWNSANDLWGP